MPKRGGRRRKTRTNKAEEVSEKELRQTPRCFIFKRGEVGGHVKDLIQNMREVMLPNTAKNLKESKMNRIEDYLAVAGGLHISHFIIFTSTKASTYMKLVKLPQGPTLTFRVDSFCLTRDVKVTQKRPRGFDRESTNAAVQVLNNFGAAVTAASGVGRPCPKPLVAEMLRSLFPAVDVPNFNEANCRRAALFHYDPESDHVHFRHFHVTKKPFGLDRGVSKLLRTVRLPKLGNKEDIADFVLGGGGAASDSEIETTQEAHGKDGKIGIRLTEAGPRMKLLLVKAEEGVCNGAVLYHRFATKTPTQQEVLEQKAKQRRKLKERNDMLTKRAGLDKDKKKKRLAKVEKAAETSRRAREALGEYDDVDEPPAEAPKAEASAGGGGTKRKRFNPLYKQKEKGGAAGKEGTVEFGDADKSGAKGKGKGKGKGKEKGEGKGKSKGGGKGGGKKGGGREKVMDRFRKAQKRQRTS